MYMRSFSRYSPATLLLKKKLHGFTLIELMVTIAVLAILLGIAVPSFNEATLGSKLRSYANNLVASINLARSEAIKRNTVMTLCISTDGASCATTGGWEQGWIVACKTTSPSASCNGSGPNWLVFHRQQPTPDGFKITESSGTPLRAIELMPTGVGSTLASFTLCRATPSVGTQQRQVSVNSTGRATVSKTSGSTCA